MYERYDIQANNIKNKEIIQSRGITLNIDGCRNGMFNGTTAA